MIVLKLKISVEEVELTDDGDKPRGDVISAQHMFGRFELQSAHQPKALFLAPTVVLIDKIWNEIEKDLGR